MAARIISFICLASCVQYASSGNADIFVDPQLVGPPVSNRVFGVNCNMGDIVTVPGVPYPHCRWGGNTATGYNYVYDITNHAWDWYFLNTLHGTPTRNTGDAFIQSCSAAGVNALLTLPTSGWVACSGGKWGPACRTKAPSFSVAKYGAQRDNECNQGSPEWCDPNAGNGVWLNGSTVRGNDISDTYVRSNESFVLSWIDRLMNLPNNVGSALTAVALDNEPGLWTETHYDVFPKGNTYDELWNMTRTYGHAIATAYPHLSIHALVSWGWCEYFTSYVDRRCDALGPDSQAHGGVPLTKWVIQQAVQHYRETGVRVFDTVDVHIYPQAHNVGGYDESKDTAAARLRSTRSLFDWTYEDESWIRAPIALIPRIKQWIHEAEGEILNLSIAVSEYQWGPPTYITSAIANVDILGIFAREGVAESARWTQPPAGSVVQRAFELFLNYDKAGSKVQGNSVNITTSAYMTAGAYAFLDSNSTLRIVITGKEDPTDVSSTTVTLNISWCANAATGSVQAKLYQFSNANTVVHLAQTLTVPSGVGAGLTTFTIPPWSASILEIPYVCPVVAPSPSPSQSFGYSPSTTRTAAATHSQTASSSSTSSITATATMTGSSSKTSTTSPSQTTQYIPNTPSITSSLSITTSQSGTPASSSAATSTPSRTASPSRTLPPSPSASKSATTTISATQSPTPTASVTATTSLIPSQSVTASTSFSPTASNTPIRFNPSVDLQITIRGGNSSDITFPCSMFAFRVMVAALTGPWDDWVPYVKLAYHKDASTGISTAIPPEALGNAARTWQVLEDEGYDCSSFLTLQGTYGDAGGSDAMARRMTAQIHWVVGIQVDTPSPDEFTSIITNAFNDLSTFQASVLPLLQSWSALTGTSIDTQVMTLSSDRTDGSDSNELSETAAIGIGVGVAAAVLLALAVLVMTVRKGCSLQALSPTSRSRTPRTGTPRPKPLSPAQRQLVMGSQSNKKMLMQRSPRATAARTSRSPHARAQTPTAGNLTNITRQLPSSSSKETDSTTHSASSEEARPEEVVLMPDAPELPPAFMDIRVETGVDKTICTV